MESRRSRSDIGRDNVCVDARLIEVEVVCWENRSLHGHSGIIVGVRV